MLEDNGAVPSKFASKEKHYASSKSLQPPPMKCEDLMVLQHAHAQNIHTRGLPRSKQGGLRMAAVPQPIFPRHQSHSPRWLPHSKAQGWEPTPADGNPSLKQADYGKHFHGAHVTNARLVMQQTKYFHHAFCLK